LHAISLSLSLSLSLWQSPGCPDSCKYNFTSFKFRSTAEQIPALVSSSKGIVYFNRVKGWKFDCCELSSTVNDLFGTSRIRMDCSFRLVIRLLSLFGIQLKNCSSQKLKNLFFHYLKCTFATIPHEYNTKSVSLCFSTSNQRRLQEAFLCTIVSCNAGVVKIYCAMGIPARFKSKKYFLLI
jgi:hypothetical protein